MGTERISAGKAPCRGCDKAAAQAPVQRMAATRAFTAGDAPAAGVHPGVLRPSSGGAPLPSGVREKMEAAFGHDFGSVRVHHGGEAESIGAAAYARGTHLHFAPGLYQPHSDQGQRLLGHELAHVVQQRAGRVPTTGGAVPVNADPALEAEADAAGARAAAAQSAALQHAAHDGGAAPLGAAIQPMFRVGARGLTRLSSSRPTTQVSSRSYRTGSMPPLITGYTDHGQMRTDTRDIDPGAQYDAVHDPAKVIDQENGKKRYQGTDATVVLSGSGKVITSWPHGKNGMKGSK